MAAASCSVQPAENCVDRFYVKSPVFPFVKFREWIHTRPEMRSTGKDGRGEASALVPKAQQGGALLPRRAQLISVNDQDKELLATCAEFSRIGLQDCGDPRDAEAARGGRIAAGLCTR